MAQPPNYPRWLSLFWLNLYLIVSGIVIVLALYFTEGGKLAPVAFLPGVVAGLALANIVRGLAEQREAARRRNN